MLHQLKPGLLAVTLAVALAALAGPGQAAQQAAPAAGTAVQEHHAGKLVFVELLTPDLAAAERFYGGLFGWTFKDIQTGAGAYASVWLDGRQVGAMLQRPLPSGKQRQSAWLSFLAATDVDAAKKLVLQQGGKVLLEPHDVPRRGREAVFADPQGAVFAALASSDGDGPDELADIGDWIWSSLQTTDPDADAAFYQGLFGYEVYELPADPGAMHLMLSSGDYLRASANTLPSKAAGVHPHWLDYVRVADAEQSVAKAVALGGRVLVKPQLDRHGGKVAVVTDPLGAPFGLLEWSDTDNKEVTK
jgi:predicted enzyme related to lactoylglutathione lyase